MKLLLLALLSSAEPARADTLLEVTGGVLGRDEEHGASEAEARARGLVERGQWGSAAVAWAEARRAGVDPDLAAAWEVVSLAHAEQWEIARLAALAAVARDPESPAARLGFAWLMCEGGAGGTARKVLRDYPVDGADGVGARVLELRSLRYDARPGRARRALRRAQHAEQTDAWLWFEAALLDLQRGHPGAIGALERAAHSEGVAAAHLAALVEVRRQLGESEQALRLGLQAMERWPEDGIVATATARVVGDPDGETLLQDALRTDPGLGAAHELAAVLAGSREDPAAAEAHLRAALDAGRATPAVYGLLGEAQAAQGDAAAALDTATEAVRRWPAHAGLLADLFERARAGDDLAVVLDAAERWRASVVDMGDAVPPPVALAAVDAAVRLERPVDALAWAERVLAEHGGQPDALVARARSLAWMERGAEALDAFETALVRQPADPALKVAFADFLLEPGPDLPADPGRAWRLASEALDAAGPDQAQVHEILARAAWAQGETGRAREHRRRALELAPEDAALADRLGSIAEGSE